MNNFFGMIPSMLMIVSPILITAVGGIGTATVLYDAKNQ